jgi:hypothetical protein
MIQQNISGTQTSETSNEDNMISESTQDRQQHAVQEHQQQVMNDQQKQSTGNVSRVMARMPQNPYHKQTFGRGGGLSRPNINPNNARMNTSTESHPATCPSGPKILDGIMKSS